MSWIHRLASSLRTRKLEEDLDKELAFHLDMRAREKTDAGITADEARRQVMGRFGSVTRVKEECREQSAFAWISALRQDLRYALRNLGRNPGFAAAAAACMAIGIGANVAIFSFVNAFLFQPIPPGVVMVQRVSGSPVALRDYEDWRRLNRVFSSMAGYSPGDALAIGRGTESERVLGETVACDYFSTLRVAPAAGRLLAPGDETHALAVVSYDFWRTHFFGDPAIAGKTIWINRQAFTVAGVAPRNFHGMLAPWSTGVWVTPYGRTESALMIFARLNSGVTAPQAATAMNSLDTELARQHPDPQRDPHDVLTVARRGGLSGSPVWGVFLAMSAVLMVVVGIIFLIACGNVAGLLMARALARRREIMIRLSLGASRSRLVRQLLTESLLLGALGAAAGVALAYSCGDALAGFMPRSITGGFRFQHAIDTHVLTLAVALSFASVLISGLAPARRASGQNLLARRSPRLRQLLIVAQVSGSVLVLAIAALFVRDFQKAQAADLGYDSAHVLSVDLDLRHLKFTDAQAADFHRQVRERVSGLSGVASVSLSNSLPLGDTQVLSVGGHGHVATATVDSDYFRTFAIPLLRGRAPQRGEINVAIVNDTLARRFWPNVDPIGKILANLQVIGVTATGPYWSLDEQPRPFIYQIASDPADLRAQLTLRTQAPPRSLAAAVSQTIQQLDPDLPAFPVRTEDERIRQWLEPQRSAALLLALLGFSALALAITALYALLAQLVAQRAQEIAVRVALGATRASVAALLLRQSALLIGAGTLLGLALATALARLLAHTFGPIGSLDAVALSGIATLPIAAGAAGTIVPTWRALRIDPATILRAE